jgi:hypothetical protein
LWQTPPLPPLLLALLWQSWSMWHTSFASFAFGFALAILVIVAGSLSW